MTGRAQHPLDRLLEDVIADEGGTCRPDEIRDELVGVIERVTAELAAAGEVMAEFCHWSISGGVGVFTFIGEELGIYVVACPPNRQWELVNRFDRMPATDVDAYRARLHARYGKERADLVIKPDLAFDWLYGDRTKEPEEPWTGELWTTAFWSDGGPETAGVEATAPDPVGAEATEPTTEPVTEPVARSVAVEPVAGETTAAVERTDAAGEPDGAPPEPAEDGDREEPRLTLLDAPTLEQMMAAIRKAGGGKGRPLRRSDFD